MRELDRPSEVESDPKATEMIRVWIANEELHVSLLLGMWQDAPSLNVDERQAWGELLADLVRQISNGLKQSHGWDMAETREQIRSSFLGHLDADEPEFSGGYSETDPQ